MQERKEKYIQNTRDIMRLMKLHISDGETEEELLRQVRASAEEVFKLRSENDHILRDEIFSCIPEEQSDEDCAALYDMAMECSRFRNSIDAGVAYRIHSMLSAAATFRGDVPKMIQELYYQGISLFYINLRRSDLDIDVYGQRIRGYFNQAAAYLEQYDQLPSESRGYIIRSMANRNLCLPKGLPDDEPHTVEAACAIYDDYMTGWRETMNIVCSPEYRQKNPELPWDVYEYSLHFDRIAFFNVLRQVQVPRIANDLMESAMYIYRHQQMSDKTMETTSSIRAIACYYIAQFHSYQITGDQLMERLLKLYRDKANPTLYGINGSYVNLQLPQIMNEYRRLGALSPEGEARYGVQLDEAYQQFHQFLMNFPYSGYNSLLSAVLADEINRPNDRGNDEFRVRLMDSIVSFHTPTYIHSCMVAYITQELISRLLEVNPQAADGVLGIPWRQLRLHRNVICDVAWKCGLYHDVGKSMVLNFVIIYNRSLLDEEFNVIKLHPKLSYHLLKKIPGDEDIAEVALRHHRNYNGRGGYPLDCPPCPPHLQVLVDALTVADCMDAATDNVGRCYAAAKSYDTLVEELFKFRGTRYAPCIVDLFQDKDFRERLGKNLAEERKHTYYDVFSTLAEEQEEG